MADDSNDRDWSDSGRPTFKKKNSSRNSGPSDLIRVMYPISNVASLRKGGKVRKNKRKKMRRSSR
jgi:hypothetical protein